jgi:hypothetical protein
MVIRQRPRKSGQSHRLLLRTILKQRELIFINRAGWREASEWDRGKRDCRPTGFLSKHASRQKRGFLGNLL